MKKPKKKKTRKPIVATLTFDLTDPDACTAFEHASHAAHMLLALEDFGSYLRGFTRYSNCHINGTPLTDADIDFAHEIRAQFYALLTERNVERFL